MKKDTKQNTLMGILKKFGPLDLYRSISKEMIDQFNSGKDNTIISKNFYDSNIRRNNKEFPLDWEYLVKKDPQIKCTLSNQNDELHCLFIGMNNIDNSKILFDFEVVYPIKYILKIENELMDKVRFKASEALDRYKKLKDDEWKNNYILQMLASSDDE